MVGTVDRGESVEGMLGGYGLYYRTPLSEPGIVARSGTLLGDEPTPVDVLLPVPAAQELAQAFRSAVADTEYYRRYMFSSGPIPLDVITDYSAVACLCRLEMWPAEQRAISNALFTLDVAKLAPDVAQRRDSFALFLSLMDSSADDGFDEHGFRSAIWEAFSSPTDADGGRQSMVSQWAGLTAKDFMQQAITSIWSEVCTLGLQNQPSAGFESARRICMRHRRSLDRHRLR